MGIGGFAINLNPEYRRERGGGLRWFDAVVAFVDDEKKRGGGAVSGRSWDITRPGGFERRTWPQLGMADDRL